MLARQIASLDILSGGRLTVGVGLGDDGWREFSSFGDEVSPRRRGEMLDEALQILQSLLAGSAVDLDGEHFTVHSPGFLPKPVQDPVPIWAAVRWPNRKPLARAARLQGCFPIFADTGQRLPPSPPTSRRCRLELAEPRRQAVLRHRGTGRPVTATDLGCPGSPCTGSRSRSGPMPPRRWPRLA